MLCFLIDSVQEELKLAQSVNNCSPNLSPAPASLVRAHLPACLFSPGGRRPTRPSRSTKGTCYADACRRRLSLCCPKLNFCHLRIGSLNRREVFAQRQKLEYVQMCRNIFWLGCVTRTLTRFMQPSPHIFLHFCK